MEYWNSIKWLVTRIPKQKTYKDNGKQFLTRDNWFKKIDLRNWKLGIMIIYKQTPCIKEKWNSKRVFQILCKTSNESNYHSSFADNAWKSNSASGVEALSTGKVLSSSGMSASSGSAELLVVRGEGLKWGLSSNLSYLEQC